MTPPCIYIITEIIFLCIQLAPTSWWTWCRRSSRRSALREILHSGRVRGIQGFCETAKCITLIFQHYSYHKIRDSALKLSFSLLLFYFYSLLYMFREDTVKRLKFLADFSETSFLEVTVHKFSLHLHLFELSSSSFFGPNVNCVTEKSMTRR